MSTALASLLCSRLCHDLVSPVGALGNGLELLDDDDLSGQGDIVSLIKESAAKTSNLLQFYRFAFGAAAGMGAFIDPRDAETVASALFAESAISLTWTAEAVLISKDAVKLALNMLLVASETIIRSGELKIDLRSNADRLEVLVEAFGERLIFKPETETVLRAGMPSQGLSPKLAPAALAFEIAKTLETEIMIHTAVPGRIALAIAIPGGVQR
ncbi:MAG: histidine phosphotransferase family protein [Pseudomonadota bacterium]